MNDRLEPIMTRLREEFGRNSLQVDGRTWRFEVLTEAGRSQVVTLCAGEAKATGKDLSRIIAFSPIGSVGTGMNLELLLRKNAELDVGAIAIEDVWTSDNIRLPFVVFRATHLIATADYPEIWELVTKTAEYADRLEKTVYAKDLY